LIALLHTLENKAGSRVSSSFTYSVNVIGQRETVTTSGGAFAGVPANWTWNYDSLGQVVVADHTNTPAADRAYEFDTIGNRKKTASGTLTLPTSNNWTSNALNQYTVANGVALPTAPAPAPFDADGNMTAGPVPGTLGNLPGVQAPATATEIQWDAENRLISYKIGATTYYNVYDHLSRLITRLYDYVLTGTVVDRRYCYDGWNRIAEYSENPTTLVDTFTWGLDLSGTMQGAGGVGGLLATRWVSSSNTDYFPTYDGNGNVSEYLATAGTVIAHYEYDPFGTLTRRTGSDNVRFQYRFSTKPRDLNSGLYYYGYRWYDPITGRWPSRDPIDERGGLNLYEFVGNDGVNASDYRGLRRLTMRASIIDKSQGETVGSETAAHGWWHAFNVGFVATTHIIGVKAAMARRIRKYSPSGKGCGDCFEKLILWVHGSPGVMRVGEGLGLSPDVNDRIRDANKESEKLRDSAFRDLRNGNRQRSEIKRKLAFSKTMEAIDLQVALEALKGISDMMCKESTVEVYGCSLMGYAKDDEVAEKSGQMLKEWLDTEIFKNSSVAVVGKGDIFPTATGYRQD
jgi:RHS repeat-associated protein